MTDHDRAERALTRALADHDRDFAPLDPAQLAARAAKRPVHRRPRWLAAAAAAVLVVAVPLGAMVLQRTPGTMTASAPAGQQPEAAPAPASDDAGAGPRAGAAMTPTRTVTVRDVAVEVPAGWGTGIPLGSDWCADPPPPRPVEPFVQRDWPIPTRDIQCPGPVPDDRQTMHLAWRPAEPGDADGMVEVGGWRHASRRVGDTYLTVVVAAGDEPVAAQVLATARVA